MKRIKILLTVLVFFFACGQAGAASAPLTQDQKTDLLTFMKDYLMLESKNTGIFEFKPDSSKVGEWFQLYGILNKIRPREDGYTVIVDADVFDYPDVHYLLYFDVAKKDGRWVVVHKRVGPRHDRQLTDQSPEPY